MLYRRIIAFALLLTASFLFLEYGIKDYRDSENYAPSADESPENSNISRILYDLGYIDYIPLSGEELEKNSIVLYDKDHSFEGINVYCDHFSVPSAGYLIDMEGEVLHKWVAFENLSWQHFAVNPQGEATVLLRRSKEPYGSLIKLDWNSNLLFMIDVNDGIFHHDVRFYEGLIYTLRRTTKKIVLPEKEFYIKDDSIAVIDNDTIVRDVSLYEVFKDNSLLQQNIKEIIKTDGNYNQDLLHANTVEPLARDIPGIAKKGDLLVCIRNLNLIAILDQNTSRILWQWGQDTLEQPHYPSLLDDGNILVFDNGVFRNYSHVIEVNPQTREIVWTYGADPKTRFFTKERGACQRLPNGNTLITESNEGHVFEVTLNGTKVWEWYNPINNQSEHDNQSWREVVYAMSRLEKKYFENLSFNRGVLP